MTLSHATNRFGLPNLGFGLGLRTAHYEHILSRWPPVDWFEIISENFMATQGQPLQILDQIAERYPIVMHGVSLNIGSTDPIDFDYLGKLKALARRVEPRWISDHICWTGVNHLSSHDLLPLPYNDEVVAHLVGRIRTVQDFLERPLLFENPSTYVEFAASTMPEWELIAQVAEGADCGLLLDVNNIYVSCFNHGWDADQYLAAVPFDRVVQIHLAGHTHKTTHIIDTHSDHVVDEVWELYRKAIERGGPRATMVEWDSAIPSFDVVHAEVLKARDLLATAISAQEHRHVVGF